MDHPPPIHVPTSAEVAHLVAWHDEHHPRARAVAAEDRAAAEYLRTLPMEDDGE
jgi:hypothetical protein